VNSIAVNPDLSSHLLICYYDQTYRYWLDEVDPGRWIEKEAGLSPGHSEVSSLLESISHKSIEKYQSRLQMLTLQKGPAKIEGLLNLPGYRHWVSTYKELSHVLGEFPPDSGGGV
jgi:hypothetical protein